LVTSLAVREELNSDAYPAEKRRNALALLDELPILDLNAQIEEVVEAYVDNLLMPQQPTADAVHLALASHYACDVLLTWNCIHLANPNKFRHIETINKRLGLRVPAVVTPLQLLGESA
jgi:predicted nucleic acid-binding protein